MASEGVPMLELRVSVIAYLAEAGRREASLGWG